MNTKQKLTLGIAAIFMVTLTIVGVTYAYFVTQVTTTTPAAVDVTTATFGDITFEKEQESVTLNSLAENDTETLKFSVSSASKTDLKYDLLVAPTDGGISFLKSYNSEDADPAIDMTCYKLADNSTGGDNCYDGTHYDNIEVHIRRYATAEAREADAATLTGGEEVYNGRLKVGTQDYEQNITIAAAQTNGENVTPTVHYYIMVVTHKDANTNQNLEQGAAVTIKPDIDSIG